MKSARSREDVVSRSKPLRMVLAGGSGQVGTILARHFHALGRDVTVLARRLQSQPWHVVHWDGATLGSWVAELEGADVLINLAGRSVNCRYNNRNRKEIMDSRVNTTHLLGEALRQTAHPPALWMNASTATIYRHSFDKAMDETTGEIGGNEPNAPSTWRFSIDVATKWEETFFKLEMPSTRKVALRSAMTMSPDRGGIFDTLLTLVRRGLGGKAGSGKQFVSWIHETDFCGAVDFLIRNEDLSGIVNLASPNPLPNEEFMRALRQAWGTKIGLPASGWMLEIGAVFIKTETELILKSRRVVPGRLLSSGFEFRFPFWPGAAKDLGGRWKEHQTRKDPR